MTSVPGLSFRWEWEPAPSVRAPELRKTWARIEISVGAEYVTLLEDLESGSSRRSIYCPLYPLAEWAAYNWWFLRADARLARYADLSRPDRLDPRRLRRHSLRGSGDGFVWPNLLILPEGIGKRLIWCRDRSHLTAQRPVRFISDGEVLLDRVSVEQELVRLISAVLTRLAEQGITGTPLEKEWTAIQGAEPDEVEFCLASARLGLDPYSEAEPYQQLIVRAASELRDDLLGDFYDAVEPALLGSALEWIREARSDIEHVSARTDAAALREAVWQGPQRTSLSSASLAWEKGWEQARAVRRALGLADTAEIALEPYIAHVTRQPADSGLLALGGATEGFGPVAVTKPGLPMTASRFTLSRALWHYLWESEPFFLVTTAYTDRQRVERAFATELLAPASGIGTLLDGSPEMAISDDIEEIAARYRVSPMVIKHQVENQLLTA
ncbi:ImmA/IrrE family metallo-endopeptidase [Nonomuraea cavernae]|uniref:ImmA/IrrE family metallo-endopeptidase n=1 Tax=Nonomuraea cavernae TaxID=2045107 RepID=UPI0033E79E1B